MIKRLSDYYAKIKDSGNRVMEAIELIAKESEIKTVFEVKGETYFVVEGKRAKK